MPKDLLSIGEAYAELDLVVRQLDDGSLTVAEDDSLPDDQRLRVYEAKNGGLAATLHVTPAPELTPSIQKAVDYLSKEASLGQFSWGNGSILREATIPWDGPAPSLDELRSLYRTVVDDAAGERDKLARIVSGAAEGVIVSKKKTSRTERPQPKRDESGPLPASFLPGEGQKSEVDRTTARYAMEGARPAPAVHGAQGGGGGNTIVMAICAVVALGIGGMLAMQGNGDSKPPPTDVAQDPGDAVPPDGDDGDDGDEPVDIDEPDDEDDGPLVPGGGGSPSLPVGDPTPRPKPPRDDPPPPPPPAASLSDEASILKAAGDADAGERLRAVKAWIKLGLGAERSGALRDLLAALDGKFESPINTALTSYLERKPPSPEEALECLTPASVPVRRALIQGLGDASLPPGDAQIVAELLSEQPETDDLLIDRTLIKLGVPKPGAIDRLAAKYGVEWIRGDDGRKLVERLASLGVEHLQPLLENKDPQLRILGCEVLAASADREALGAVSKLLGDSDVKVRRRVVECLQELGDPKASWPLARALSKEQDRRTRDLMEVAFSRLPAADTARYLKALLSKGKGKDPAAAVEALKCMKSAEATPVLLAALSHADVEVQTEALAALRSYNKQTGLSASVEQGLLQVRQLALDGKADKSVRKLARQLHYDISGRFPQ